MVIYKHWNTILYINILFGIMGDHIFTTPTGLSDAGKKYVGKQLFDGSSQAIQICSVFQKATDLVFNSDSEKLQFELQCEHLKECLGVSSLKELIKKLVMDYYKLTQNRQSETPN